MYCLRMFCLSAGEGAMAKALHLLW